MIIKNNKKLKQKEFVNEKELQQYVETNLTEILDFEFIDSEFSVNNYRIDTVAFDNELNAFRIIEYKNIKNRSLIDQGYTYLKILHERKADFVLRYNELKNKSLKISDVDWSQSRIVFISPHFSNYQLDATSFKNLPFDLFKINKYEENIVVFEYITKTSNVKVETFQAEMIDNDVLKEIVVYTEEKHLENKPKQIIDLYYELKEEILELGDISIEPQKHYIAFKGNRNIIDLEIQNRKIKVNINLKIGLLKDPENLAIDQSTVGTLGNGDYRIELSNLNDKDYILYLIKQSYEINKK